MNQTQTELELAEACLRFEPRIRWKAGAKAVEDACNRLNSQAYQKPLGLSQGEFANNYDPEELSMLGKMLKYCGLYGVTARIIGKNSGEATLEQDRWLCRLVEKKLPDFVEAVAISVKAGSSIMCHQNAFAYDYQEEEYLLLGAVVKYCGLYGVDFTITGTNREELPKPL